MPKYKINEVVAKNRTHAVTIINGRRVNLLATKDEKIKIPATKTNPEKEVTLHAPSQKDMEHYHNEMMKGSKTKAGIIMVDTQDKAPQA